MRSHYLRKLEERFNWNRRNLLSLILMTGLIYILVTSFGGSQTQSFDYKEDRPDLQDRPEQINQPFINFENLTSFPENYHPPDDVLDKIIGSDNLHIPDDLDIPPGEEDKSNSSLVDPRPDPNPRPIPDPDDVKKDHDGDTVTDEDKQETGTKNELDRPSDNDRQLPNKARNLWNLSSLVNFSIFGQSIRVGNLFSNFTRLTVNNVLFAMIISGMLFIPKSAMEKLLEQSKKADAEYNTKNSLFFIPDQEKIQSRRERARKKKLKYLSDYVDEIILKIQNSREYRHPKELVTWTYLELDKAFTNFGNIKRDLSMTPYEHAQETFEDLELEKLKLERLVEMFYLTRFGNKEMDVAAIDELISILQILIIKDTKIE